MKYRRKPTFVEAEQLTRERIEAYVFDAAPLPQGVTCTSASSHPGRRELHHALFYVVNIHGHRTPVVEGNWIIAEPDGEHFYPCKPDIFAATYEAAE